MNTPQRFISHMVLGVLLLISVCQQVLAENRIYSFGVVPQQSASKLARTWGPILAHISKETGLELRFKTAPNIPEFEKRLLNSEYDFAYMNPYHYVVFSHKPGYRAFANARDKKIKGILVVHKDSTITDIGQLADQSLAFPSPAAFAASILPRAELKKNNIAITPKYVSSHDSVYRNVAKGIYPAGGGIIRTLNALDPDIKHQLKVLWTSAGFTPHALAAHPRVAEEDVASLRQAFINLENNEEGKQLLDTLKIKGWQAAGDSDWDDVRALNLDTLDDLIQ